MSASGFPCRREKVRRSAPATIPALAVHEAAGTSRHDSGRAQHVHWLHAEVDRAPRGHSAARCAACPAWPRHRALARSFLSCTVDQIILERVPQPVLPHAGSGPGTWNMTASG